MSTLSFLMFSNDDSSEVSAHPPERLAPPSLSPYHSTQPIGRAFNELTSRPQIGYYRDRSRLPMARCSSIDARCARLAMVATAWVVACVGCVGGGSGVTHVAQGPVDGSPAPYPPANATFGPDGGGGPRPLDTPVEIPALAWSHPVAQDGYTDGAPIGGLGAGSITWRFDGSFYQDRITVGANTMAPDPECGFTIYEKAGTARPRSMRLDSTALAPTDATYHALFPRAFVDYHPAALACPVRVEQWSPLIPGDYRHASYPVGVYRWEITNPTAEPCDVAIMPNRSPTARSPG
jgi:hypothetical protein